MSHADDEHLDGFPTDEHSPICLHRLPYAHRVAELIRRPGGLERWRHRCHESFQESRLRHKQLHDWQKDRQEPYALNRLADDGCPYAAPELRNGQEPYAGGPLPFSSRHALSLADAYFVLALIHDADRRDAGRINPFGPDDEPELTYPSDAGQEWVFWHIMASHVSTLRASDQITLDNCLAQIEDDLRTPLANGAAAGPASGPVPMPLASAQSPLAQSRPAHSSDQHVMEPNPFRQLCALALQIREQELERDRTPAHERRPHTVEYRATLEDRLRDLVADCCVASRCLGDHREREAEEAARQLADACIALLVWEGAVRLHRLSAEEAGPEKGGPCVALCNRLNPSFDRVDHLARLFDRINTSRIAARARTDTVISPPAEPTPPKALTEGARRDISQAILARTARRKEKLDELMRIEECFKGKRSRVIEALRRFGAIIRGPNQLEERADALLMLCQAVRNEGFGQGIENILDQDRQDRRDNDRLAIDLYRRGWGGDRQVIVDLLNSLDRLPERADNFDENAPCRLLVWNAVQSMINHIMPLPFGSGGVPPWHADVVKAGRLQAELANQPTTTGQDTSAEEAANPVEPRETATQREEEQQQASEPESTSSARLAGPAAIRAAIERERVVLELLGNTQNTSGIDWQAGVNQLYKLWREELRMIPPPPRPAACVSYQQAADAVDALLRELDRISPTASYPDPQRSLVSVHSVQLPTVAVITALPHETAAVRAVFGDPPRFDVPGSGAGRAYWMAELPSPLGGRHRVVIAQADMGNNIAAVRASLLLSHFPSVESIIMCGIAGGIPNPTKVTEHVRLGDVVVSNQKGVVQYDFVKRAVKKKRTDFAEEVRASTHRPSAALYEAVRIMESNMHFGNFPWEERLREGLARLKWARPDDTADVLADPANEGKALTHPPDPERRPGQPRVFLGPIASANTLLKDPSKRDALRSQFGVKAVEMEGSGIQDASWTHGVGYLVVRGICDYCDRNKNDDWQKYAAMAAAGYLRALLVTMLGTASDLPQ
jgi:nucleoside phosphorylase